MGGGGSTIGGGGVRLGGGGAGGLAKGGDADAGRGGTARVETCGGSTCNPGGTKRDGGPDSGVDAGDARDAADAGDARDAGDASDASSVVSCTVDSDCTWGEISHDIAQSADCMCLYGCPSIAMNVATSARRSAQYAALCEPEHDGAGRLCGIDDCAAPPPIACIAHECRTASRRTGLACATPADCGDGYACITDAPGGYCAPGAGGAPTNCAATGVECPAGTACAPLPWSSGYACLQKCSADTDCRANYLCRETERYPATPSTDRSLEKVCWTACTPGIIPSCNPNAIISSIHGTCLANGTCQCSDSFAKDSATGRCN